MNSLYDSFGFPGGLMPTLLFGIMIVLTACASGPYRIDLMPAPDVYEADVIEPFTDSRPIETLPVEGVFYATDRAPAEAGDWERFYGNERGHVVRLGKAQVQLGKEDVTWEEARRISLLKNRPQAYPLQVTQVEEFGILDRSITVFTESLLTNAERHLPAQRFAAQVNDSLQATQRKDIYIYVHGYKVIFDSPVLVATELWHYLGYDGVFMTYTWPATPSRWAYFADLETTAGSARHFRIFLQYLAATTDAEQIHIIGYSAGTRLVARTLEQLAFIYQDQSRETIQERLRLGHVILVGSDIDRQIFGAYLADGLLKIPSHLTIYLSDVDAALGLSRWIFGRQRVGELFEENNLAPEVVAFLQTNADHFHIIDVTEAEESTAASGHGYFRQSPWVSSDILMTLKYNLSPRERGLLQSEDSTLWRFPADYIARLRAAVTRAKNSALSYLESLRV